MSQRRIKKRRPIYNRTAPGRPDWTIAEKEAQEVLQAAAEVPDNQKLGFILASLSDEFLRDVNGVESTHSISPLLVIVVGLTAGGDGWTPGAIEFLHPLINKFQVLTVVEELRRCGLARIQTGYPSTILDDVSDPEFRLPPQIDEIKSLSVMAQKTILYALEKQMGR